MFDSRTLCSVTVQREAARGNGRGLALARRSGKLDEHVRVQALTTAVSSARLETQAADGLVRPGDPTFSCGFVAKRKRNRRTFAGVDRAGRTLLVTVDGRSVDDLCLSIPETADVAQSLSLLELSTSTAAARP